MFPIFSPTEAPPPNQPAASYSIYVLVSQAQGEAPQISSELSRMLLSEAIETLPEEARGSSALLGALTYDKPASMGDSNSSSPSSTPVSSEQSPEALFAQVLAKEGPHSGGEENPKRVFIEGPQPLPDSLEAALQQTWDWPQAEKAVSQSVAAYRIEHKDPSLDRHTRLLAIRAVIGSLSAYFSSTNTQVTALYWQPAERLVDPEAYQESVAHEAAVGDYALNVHLYRLKDGSEHLMETRGLSPFGLPDLQISFWEYDPGEVAQLLLSYGEYLYENGDVIKHEDEVRGVNEDQVWTCERGHSFTVPAREAIEFKHRQEEGSA